MISIDLRRTRDGVAVVFHNRRLDVVTSGQGEVASQTYDEVRRAHLKNGETIPRFDEIGELARGRAVLWLNFKDDVVAEVSQWIAGHGSFDDAIFYLDHPDLTQSAVPFKRRTTAMMVMTRAYKRADLERDRKLLGQLPDLIHIHTTHSTEVSWFREQGVKVAIKALGLEQLWGLERGQRRVQALTSGAQLILVDEPLFFNGGPGSWHLLRGFPVTAR